ncbi:MAG: ATP-binding protein [Spirochaetia bacterium]
MVTAVSLVVCRSLERETRNALKDFKQREVRLYSYADQCMSPPADLHDLFSRNEIPEITSEQSFGIIIGGGCIRKAAENKIKDTQLAISYKNFCGEYIFPPSFLDEYLNEGYYIVTSGWLFRWKENLESFGFKDDAFKEFMDECSSGILLLDTGLYEIEKKIDDFQSKTGLPVKVVKTGLDYFKTVLHKILLEKILEFERDEYRRQNDTLNKRLADYAMVFDLFQDIISLREEQLIIERFSEITSMITAPKEINYLTVQDGAVIKTGTDISLESFKELENFSKSEQEVLVVPKTAGLLGKVRHGKELVGLIGIKGVMFPKYLERYLGILQGVISFIGLAVGNARSFYQTRKLVEELQDSNENAVLMNNQLEEALESAKVSTQRAVEANQVKSRFIANVSHEIRTPLHGIMGILELLKSNPGGESSEEYITLAEKSGNLLLSLINELIDAAKLDTGKMTLEPVPFNLLDLLTTIYRTFKNQAEQKNVKLILRVDKAVPEYVKGDSRRLSQILFNLLGNALKFTEKGEIEIDADVPYKDFADSKTKTVTISVKDTGIGIPENKLDDIFTPFSQVESGSTRRYEGTGLGLSIAKNLSFLMNGDLAAESKLGKGSVLTLTVPLEIIDESSVTTVTPVNNISLPRKQGRVLIVEDDNINGLISRMMVNRFGYSTELARTGSEAVELVSSGRFDLVILDCYLPDMEGWDVTMKIRNLREGAAEIPIIGSSAAADKNLISRWKKAGINDILSKPYTPQDLHTILDKWMNRKT